MINKKVCAYIDIIGFKNIIKSDLEGAYRLLDDYHNIIHMKKTDEKMFKHHYKVEEKDITLKSLFEESIIDSFEYFIPFSDSAFIISDNPSKFVRQISNFLLGSFMLGGYVYDDSHFRMRSDLLTISNINNRKWYPLLFKGGIAFSECIPIRIMQIVESKLEKSYNVFGKAVVEAVGLAENQNKGPRLFCSEEFANEIRDGKSRSMVISDGNSNVFEILWPVPYIEKENINGYRKLLEISLNLWQYYNHEEFGIHYFRFVELVIKSILEVYRNYKRELQKAKDTIARIFEDKLIDIKKIRQILTHYSIKDTEIYE